MCKLRQEMSPKKINGIIWKSGVVFVSLLELRLCPLLTVPGQDRQLVEKNRIIEGAILKWELNSSISVITIGSRTEKVEARAKHYILPMNVKAIFGYSDFCLKDFPQD